MIKKALYCAKFTGFIYIPAATEPIKENIAIAFGTPSDIRIGKTITPIAITGPAPVIAVKIIAVTIFRSVIVTIGLSPPSSTVFLISVEAIPVSISTRPNHAPQQTLTKVVPQPSGALWKILFKAVITPFSPLNCSASFCARKSALAPRVPANDKTVQIIVMIKKPIIRLLPDIQYHANPKKVNIRIIPIIYSIISSKNKVNKSFTG